MTLSDVCSGRWSPTCTPGWGTVQRSDAAIIHRQPPSCSASHAAFCQKNTDDAMVTKGLHRLERAGLDKSCESALPLALSLWILNRLPGGGPRKPDELQETHTGWDMMFGLQVGAPSSFSGEKVVPGLRTGRVSATLSGCLEVGSLCWVTYSKASRGGGGHARQLWVFRCPVTSTCLVHWARGLEKDGLSSWPRMGGPADPDPSQNLKRPRAEGRKEGRSSCPFPRLGLSGPGALRGGAHLSQWGLCSGTWVPSGSMDSHSHRKYN